MVSSCWLLDMYVYLHDMVPLSWYHDFELQCVLCVLCKVWFTYSCSISTFGRSRWYGTMVSWLWAAVCVSVLCVLCKVSFTSIHMYVYPYVCCPRHCLLARPMMWWNKVADSAFQTHTRNAYCVDSITISPYHGSLDNGVTGSSSSTHIRPYFYSSLLR